MCSVEIEEITLDDGAGGRVELFVADGGLSGGGARRPALLLVHGHQFPDRPGGRGRLKTELMARLQAKGGIVAAMSQPGYGSSTGPPDCCGPRTQAALRLSFAHVLDRGAAACCSIVWGFSRGAVTASCAFVDGTPEPGVLILQAGTYDMRAWVDWVEAGAPGGDAALSRAILANQQREAGPGEDALRARSGVVQAGRGGCDVLLVHGARDPQAPSEDRAAMVQALKAAGRRVETAIDPDGAHGVPPQLAMDALEQHWPELAF